MLNELFLAESFFWTCLWQSTIFIAAGLLSSFILRHRSARAHQVLLLSMIAAVIVPVISTLVKHYELGFFTTESAVIQVQSEHRAIASNLETPEIIPPELTGQKPGVAEKDLTSVITASENTKFPWRSVVLYGWLMASLIFAARLLITFISGICLLGRAIPLDCDRIEQAVHLAKAKLRINKDVSLYSSRGVQSPVIWCWKRSPTLLLPSAAGQSDNRINWAGVLCHELAHYKRRDHISGLSAELLICIMPWHPLLWWAKSRLIRLSEQACDDWVVATGQPCTDYAESLLDLTPCGQMAFVPAVVSSKKGLAGRIQRILKDSCQNPRTGAVWALTVTIVVACFAAGIAFAQTRPSKTEGQNAEEIESSRRRIISFPEDRSMGKLFARDSGQDSWYEGWQELGEAKGDVSVAAGKEVKLQISEQAAGDLTALDKLEADDLQMLSFGWKAMKVGSLGPIGNLKGLQALNIQRAKFDSEDFKHLTGLAQIEVLRCGDHKLTDTSMKYVGQLTSLRSLALWGTGISDEGLKHLQGLTNLTFLALNRCEITDQGLDYLRNMTALEGLQIYQTKITDNGLKKLRGFTQLKHVKLDGNGITDAGLKHIEDLTSLENIWINSNPITDKGLSCLAGMKNLKQLYALHTEITDAGLANFKGAKDIRFVVNPKVDPGTAKKIESSAVQDIIVPTMTMAKPDNPNNVESNVIVLRLVDSDGRPVAGAKAGTNVRTRDISVLGSNLSWNLRGKENNVSNELGEITLTRDNLFTPSWPVERKLALYVLHEDRLIGATYMTSRDGKSEEIELTLEPVCHVHGKLSSEGLKKIGRPLTWTNVYMYWDRDSFGVLSQMSENQRFEFLVPPGRYTLNTYGSGEGSRTKHLYPEIEVKANQSELDLGVIDLPPTKITSLIGKPAIEFCPIKAWKNGPPVKLADLKGKAVIIYFDGDSPNTSRDLPRFVDLHNQFADKGLVIIALYNCPDMEYLDKKWIEIYERFGGVTDVPFRVAIDGGESTFYEDTDKERLGATYGAYDITGDPTTILIDPDGKIVGSLNLYKAKEILEEMLGVKPALPTWRQRFDQVYRLDPKQVIKRISPPFIPERNDYYFEHVPDQARAIPDGPRMMTFSWDGKLDPNGGGFGGVRDLTEPLDLFGLESYEYEGPEELLSLKLPGDWIVRTGTTIEERMRALQQLLAEELGRQINFEKRTVERNVIVASGSFKFHPLSGTYNDSCLHLYSDKLDPDSSGGGTADSVAELLTEIGDNVEMPVIDETETHEEIRIPHGNHNSCSLGRIKNENEKRRKLEMLLANITKQTELQFKVENRPAEIWFVTEDKDN